MCQCGVPKAVKVVRWQGVKHSSHNDEKSLNCSKQCFCRLFGANFVVQDLCYLPQWDFFLFLLYTIQDHMIIVNNNQVSKLGPNLGREFFCCPKPMDSQCQVLYHIILDQVKKGWLEQLDLRVNSSGLMNHCLLSVAVGNPRWNIADQILRWCLWKICSWKGKCSSPDLTVDESSSLAQNLTFHNALRPLSGVRETIRGCYLGWFFGWNHNS